MKKIEEIVVKNPFHNKLPGDHSLNPQCRLTPNVFYADVLPTPVIKPHILCWSDDLARVLDISPPVSLDGPEAEVLAGNRLLPGEHPYATRYGGHQFGSWAGQLGDGRAISLGVMEGPQGERWELQLKGAGPTPYARFADGRAVLRSSIREFICSEAMHHLGIPTTRALACVTTGEHVMRDMFYDGRPAPEPGAVVTRVAPSFLRFGHLQILTAFNENHLVKSLLEHLLSEHYPGLPQTVEEGAAPLFREIARRTCQLMVEWLRVGFVHGVMNTDNMSLLGLTIDYGPFGWLDTFDPNWTPNTTDAATKIYRFANQPERALWNLACLAETFAPFVSSADLLRELENYKDEFQSRYRRMQLEKLGLEPLSFQEDTHLIENMHDFLQMTEIDPTFFFRRLAQFQSEKTLESCDPKEWITYFEPIFYQSPPLEAAQAALFEWLKSYLKRAHAEGKVSPQARAKQMNLINPYFLPRNFIVQQVIDDLSIGETQRLSRVLQALKTPYEDNEWTRPFFQKRPDWAAHTPGCSMLSCSS